MTENRHEIREIDVRELNAMSANGDFQVIDVREFSEFDGERIEGARLMSLSNFDKYIAEINRSQPICLMCRSGNRARTAAAKLTAHGFTDVAVVKGGMTAWREANLPIITGESKVWSLERQVRFAAGSLVVLGVLLSLIAHSYFVWLSAFIGAGLVFAAVTDTCGMAMVLAKMPWNQPKQAVCDAESAQKS